MPSAEDPTTSINPIDALIADYLQEVENGKVPDRRAWLDRNPDHAEALQAFFSDFDRMDRVAAPLRMADDIDETADVKTTGPALLTTVRYFGDYELLEEVAQGGMGVVYKARQRSLNRLVALKMILAGTFATPREVARFQAEAEAAANLDHPGIVPVYEVGEHAGQQYFSMKFIEGGSLANLPRLDIKTEVQGLIAIARAVHHAHQHGVLHRDLKPSNVLVDSQGNRLVTDFGLAKRLSEVDRSFTEVGQILGTPRYMSPEQAAGRKDLTVATDVYALGVILYERLTGRTPFQAQTPLELLRQVRETEPPRPSGLSGGLDRDLETIVLKSLEKDPASRYPTAQDLVEDLTRWLEGRPIAARPVGQTERFVRWCRRNPVVAGLTASVVMALLMGVIVSSLFAYQERKARIRAEMAEDTTERALARSLVRPLNVEGLGEFEIGMGLRSAFEGFGGVKKAPIAQVEEVALWELAIEGSESLRMRFLKEAIRDPLTLRQILARSEPAKVAALGLDAARLARAQDVLFERLRDPSMKDAERIDLAIFTLLFEDRPDRRFDEAANIIAGALEDKLSDKARGDLEDKILLSATQINAKRAIDLLLKVSERSKNSSFWEKFALIEPTLSAQLDAEQLNNVCVQLCERIRDAKLPAELGDLSGALNWLAPRLRVNDAEALASWLMTLLEKEKWDVARSQWVKVLSSLSPKLGVAQTSTLCRQLLAMLEGEKDPSVKSSLVDTIEKLIDRLDSSEMLMVARRFVTFIEGETDRLWKRRLVLMLLSLSPRLTSSDISSLRTRIAELVVLTMKDEVVFLSGNSSEGDSTAIYRSVEAMTTLTVNLERSDATVVALQAIDSLEMTKDVGIKASLAAFLARILTRVTSTEQAAVAMRAARALIQASKDEKEQNARGELFGLFAPMCLYLDPIKLTQFIDPVISVLKQDEYQMAEAAAGHLSPVVERLDLSDVLRCVNELILEAEKGGLPNSSTLSDSLSAFSLRLDSSQAAAFSERLFAKWEREPDAGLRTMMTGTLSAFSSRLDSSRASAFSERLFAKWERDSDVNARRNLAQAYASFSSRLTGSDASKYAIRVIMLVERESNPEVRTSLGQALSAVSSNLDASEVKMIARRLAAQKDVGTIRAGDFVDSMLIMLSRIEANEAKTLAHQVTRAMIETSLRYDREHEHDSDYVQPILLGAIQLLLAQYESPELTLEMASLLCSGAVDDSNADQLRGLIAPITPRRAARGLLRLSIAEIQFGTSGAIDCVIREAGEVVPCRLKTQEIVDLLKMPTVVGKTRRMLLDQLEGIHGRRFANHWEFVRFAQETGLKLDFLSPPRRADPHRGTSTN